MRLFPVAALAAALSLANSAAALAATAFFYSDPEEYYGWAAGYNYSRSEGYAHTNCNKGGSDCRFVLECNGGWSAVAFADGFAKGVGFSCGYAAAIGARVAALATCIAVSNTLCWTSSTISGNGKQRSDKDNGAFDRTWYVQQMLHVIGFDPGEADGEMGGKTRTAIKRFQASIGMEQTGESDDTLFVRLFDAFGGRHAMTKGIREGIVDPMRNDLAKTTYARASQPYAVRSFAEEVAARPDEQRRLTLATLLSSWGTRCTLPARSVSATPPDGTGAWLVTCDEGAFTVLMSAGTHVVMPGLIDPAGARQAPPPKPGNQVKPKTPAIPTVKVDPGPQAAPTPVPPVQTTSKQAAAPAAGRNRASSDDNKHNARRTGEKNSLN